MRKILSFLTAILFAGSMMAMEIAVPATTLDLQNPTMVTDAGWAGEVAYYLDDDVLITSGQESRLSFEKQTWITKQNTGSSNNTWDALAPFKGSDFYSNKAYATLQADRYTAYLVTGCDSVWVYGYNNANSGKYLIMDVYEIAGEVATINTDETAATYSVNDEAAGKANVVLKQALDATKKYLVVTTGAGASNSRVFEIAFFRHSDVAKTYWTVAGSSEVAFGTTWDPANKANDMVKQEDGSYKWEKTELELAAGEIAFKVCKDHAWTEAYPASDYKLPIAEAGIYTITITFEPENENKVSAVATKTGEAVVLPTVVLHGNFFGDWKDTDPFAPAEDKLTAKLTLSLAEGNYEFGFKFDGSWKANGANITREENTANLATGSGNMHFAADVAGEYELTYTFETQTLVVAYPDKPEVLPEGAYKLTFNGTGTGSDNSVVMDASVAAVFTEDCQAKVASVDSLANVYAGRVIAEDPSSLKFGTSSKKGALVFTLAEPVEVDSIIVNATQYGNNAAEVTVNGIKIDLTQGNKVPKDYKLIPNGTISEISIIQTGSERIYLRYVTVYAKTSPTPPTPPTPVTLPVVALAGGMNGWSADANILVAAEDSLSASVKVALEAGDVEFKIVSDGKWLSLNGEDPDGLYTFHRDWTTVSHVNVIDGRNFKLTADVAGDYIFTWTYADSTLAITFPAKPEPVEDNFWKATSETAVTPEAVYVDDDMLTLSTVFAGTLKENARTIAAVDFTHAIQVRVNAWPTEEVKTGTEKSGSTPLVLTAKEDIAITLYYNRQTVDGTGTENDNKDVWVFDHTAITTPMTGDFIIDQILDEDKYLNATKKLQLVKGHTYTIAAKGTTLQLHGIKYEASEVPADPTAAVTGDMTEWGEPIPFELSMDKTFASYTNDNIKAGTYAFKMIINGEWRSNGYEFHRGFPGCAGISGNTEANMTVVLDVEGAYTFEWYFANDSLAIKFPAKPEPVLTDGYYLMGSFNDWAIAAENLLVANPDAEGEYQLDINLTAGDEIKVAYVEADVATTWFPKEGNYIVDANHSGATTMYFRPNYNEEWVAFGGYFYIVPTGTEGIEEILSEGKAVKVLHEGKLLIMKGNHSYTPMGQIVK